MSEEKAVETVKAINQANKNLTKAKDLKEDMKLLMAPHANWEQFLTPAPITIALLGELMLISTTKDFSLAKKPPKDGFQLLKYPESFRGCLVQVGNEGWEAFNMAHKNMDQIRLLSGNVPENVKNAVQVLLKGSPEDIADVLPIELGAVKTTAEKCVKNASEVEKRFVGVMALIGELLEACIITKGHSEAELAEKQKLLEVKKFYKQNLEEEKKRAEAERAKLEESYKRAEERYDTALNSFPSGLETATTNFVEGLMTSGNRLIDGLSTSISQGVNLFSGGIAGGLLRATATATKLNASHPKENPKLDSQTIKSYCLISEIATTAMMLVNTYLVKEKFNTENMNEKDPYYVTATAIFKHLSSEAAGITGDSQAKAGLTLLCQLGSHICEEMKKMSEQMNEDLELQESLAKDLVQLHGETMRLEAEAKVMTGGAAVDALSPNQFVAQANSSGSAGQMAVQNARFKAESAHAILEKTQENYTKSCEQLSNTSQNLAKIMGEMAQLDLEKIDFEQIKQALVKGIKALSKLREEWTKLVQFFQMMSNIIECSLNVTLKSFLQHAEAAEKKALSGYSMSSFKKDLIYQQAFQASKIAYLVNMISGSYVEVSKEYLMERIAGLGRLLALDIENNASDIRKEMHGLTSGCQEAQRGIEDIVQKNKADFDIQIEARMKRIETEMKGVLPVPEPDDPVVQRTNMAIEQAKQVETPPGTNSLDVDEFA